MIRTKSIIVLLTLSCLISCNFSSKKDYKLSDERLAHLMLDLQLAEVSLPDMDPKQQDSIKMIYNKRLEEIYHMTPDEIKQEMDILQSDPTKLKWVINRAKEMADSIQ